MRGAPRAAGRDPVAAEEHLDLAALATVCDLVPLRGENRRIVREGLVALARTEKPGLRALMAVAAVAPAELPSTRSASGSGPRINAAGRMRRADAALELLLTEDAGRAAEVARELDLLNPTAAGRDAHPVRGRGRVRAPGRARPRSSWRGRGGTRAWSGIVASRLVERWRRPLRGDRARRGRVGTRVGPQHLRRTTCTPAWPPARRT